MEGSLASQTLDHRTLGEDEGSILQHGGETHDPPPIPQSRALTSQKRLRTATS